MTVNYLGGYTMAYDISHGFQVCSIYLLLLLMSAVLDHSDKRCVKSFGGAEGFLTLNDPVWTAT